MSHLWKSLYELWKAIAEVGSPYGLFLQSCGPTSARP